MRLLSKRPKNYEMDMCNGPLFSKIVSYAIPLMLSGILQLLYNAADIVVVGRFAGSVALAAVGSTGSLINLIVNVFIGISVGTSVVVAQSYGAGDVKSITDTVHTSITIAGIFGVILGIFGITMARPLLEMMGSPADVIDAATLYVKIYFVGMPAFMLYNFGAAVLRAIGDTRRPLYILTVSGLINVILNLIFVIGCGMTVDGVAWATTISQYISAGVVLYLLVRADGPIKLHVKKLRIHKDKLLQMIRVGLPAGLQGSLFSISNVIIQSSINSFGSVVMAGNAAASNIEGFAYTCMNAIYQAAITFTGQNMGAKKYKRIDRITWMCAVLVSGAGLFVGLISYFAAPILLRLYSTDPEVIEMGIVRMQIICTTQFICGLMDMFVGVMRGMGYSVLPMIVSLTGVCGLRIVWIFTVFASLRSLPILYSSYPITWFFTGLLHFICFLAVRKKLQKRVRDEGLPEEISAEA